LDGELYLADADAADFCHLIAPMRSGRPAEAHRHADV